MILEESEESFEDELVFLFDDISDGSGCEQVFCFFEHDDQSFYLFLILFSDFFVGLDFELQAFCVIDPVDSFAPGCPVLQFLENVMKLFLSLFNIFLLIIDHQVVVFSENGDQGVLFQLHAPG